MPRFFTVTYRGRRDADYTVVIGSRATGTFIHLIFTPRIGA